MSKTILARSPGGQLGRGGAVGRLPAIVARDCRAWVAEHCGVDVVAAAYERTYRSVAIRRAVRGVAHV